jgi:SAM-dependent methyltransferase
MAVSEEEVVWCYRLLLGREPESAQAISRHMGCEDLATLRQVFIRSGEFSTRWRRKADPAQQVRRLPLDIPAIEVEHAATESQLQKCLEKIRAAWSHMGITTPHFSVLTNKQFLPGALGKNLKKFWASGDAEAGSVEKILTRHGLGSLNKLTCVEYGCGVGRVTTGLARRFAVLHAYDISPGHLALARQRAHEVSVSNCQFHLCSENTLSPLESCDFYYSKIVFQHNPPPIIVRLVENAIRALRPNGIGIFQVPTYYLGYQFVIKEWLATDHGLGMQMHCLPQRVILAIIRDGGGEVLELREDSATGDDRGISNTFVVRKVG